MKNPFPDLTAYGSAFLIMCALLSYCKKDNPVQHATCNDGSMLNIGNCDSVCADKGGVKYCFHY